jgi:hypothetical protein
MENLEEVCLMNLGKMQMVKHCQCKLSGWKIMKPQKVIIKYYHIEEKRESFDDSLLISIGERDQQML